MRNIIAVAATVLLLAGCVSPTPSMGGARPLATLKFDVTSAKVVPGRCFDGAQDFGEVCHVLGVHLDNAARTNDLETNTLTWKAVDVDGKLHDFGASDTDAVAGGTVANITVSFTLPDGAVHLAKLRYESFAAKGEAAVPSY